MLKNARKIKIKQKKINFKLTKNLVEICKRKIFFLFIYLQTIYMMEILLRVIPKNRIPTL